MLGLLILLVFAAVVLMTLVLISGARRALQAYERGFLERGKRTLTEMFIFVERRQLLVVTIAATAAAGLVGFILFNWFIAAVLIVVGFFAPPFVIKKLRERRVREFDRQLVDTLMQMASAFRAGLTFGQAAENVAHETPAPLGDEFKLVVREMKLGVAQDEALKNLAQRVQSESLLLTVTATSVCRQLGGNISEIYEVIAETVRDRFQMEGKVQALTAMGRMQAWVVGAMPLVMGVAFNFIRPDLMEPMLSSSFGKGLVVAILVMEGLGLWLIRRVVDIEI